MRIQELKAAIDKLCLINPNSHVFVADKHTPTNAWSLSKDFIIGIGKDDYSIVLFKGEV